MVIIMHTLNQIADYLKEHNNYIIIPHRSPDGDCLGSSSALLLALRSLGKNARIALPSPIPGRLLFIWDESYEQGDFEPECAISVDVASDYMMLELFESTYKKAGFHICIDHHATNEGFGDMNYVAPDAAATGEIIYELICELGADMQKEIAERIFVAIADDTGGFQYSNTTAKTHRIVSELYGANINSDEIMRLLFATHTMAELNLLRFVASRMEFHFGGKVCSSFVDSEALDKSGAEMSNADAWISLTRSGEGVEVGLMFKVISDTETRVSLRSNSYVDVSAVAKKFGGGGHVRAAGVTFNEGYESAKEKLLNELEKLV